MENFKSLEKQFCDKKQNVSLYTVAKNYQKFIKLVENFKQTVEKYINIFVK